MYLLGYSGLNNQAQNNISPAAVLLRDGVMIGACEEKCLTPMGDVQPFPFQAIQFCLNRAKIKMPDVNYICHGYDYSAYQTFFQQNKYSRAHFKTLFAPDAQIARLQTYWPDLEVEKIFVPVEHHHAHAASVFYPSGYNQALVLVADRIAEANSISVYCGKDNQLQLLKSYDCCSSIGMLYAIISDHLGFANQENKVMALAAYGDPQRFAEFFSEYINLEPEGKINIHGFLKNAFLDRENDHYFRQMLTENAIPPRSPKEPLKQQHKDLAAGLQKAVNKMVLHLLTYWRKETGLKKLCYAGGVALNCVTNGHIYRSGLFDNIYIHSAAGNAGSAWGAALYHYNHTLAHQFNGKPADLPFFGPEMEVRESLIVSKKEELDAEDMLERAAEFLAEGMIIVWIQGRMEFGQKALGNRSILADPGNAQLRDKLNRLFKKRECFGWLSASVKRDKAHLFFEMAETEEFPCMMFTVPVQENYRKRLSAITQVNGMAEVQTVDKNQHTYFWRLLDKFEKKTGSPILLNTSFNIDQQPICSIDDAIETFIIKLGLDALFVENYVFYNAKQKASTQCDNLRIEEKIL